MAEGGDGHVFGCVLCPVGFKGNLISPQASRKAGRLGDDGIVSRDGFGFHVGSVILADALRGTGIAGPGLRPCICRIPVVVEGGDFRSVFQLDAAALAVGVAGVALLGAGGSLGVLYLGAAIVIVRICVTPLVDVSIRSLVVAGTAVCVVLRRGNTGGLGLQVHIALNEKCAVSAFRPFSQ